jgi:hypothetical protein
MANKPFTLVYVSSAGAGPVPIRGEPPACPYKPYDVTTKEW